MRRFEAVLESSMCALLRGEPAPWPELTDAEFERRFRGLTAYHGVGPLLTLQLSRAQPRGEHVLDTLCPARELKDEAAIELIRKQELVRVLEALAQSGVEALLLKGAALAYSIYPLPVLRPRADTDLLIPTAGVAVAARVLAGLGYEKPNAVSGALVQYQCGYVMRDRFGIDHVLDVHWRVSNTQMFSRTLDYEELNSRSVPVAALGAYARGLGPADALLLACMHRAHHLHTPYYVEGVDPVGGDRLIWLYDFHLLVDSMSYRELEEFAQLAGEKGMRDICDDGLLKARRCFGTRIPAQVRLMLAGAGAMERSAAHLRTGSLGYFLTELRSLPRWRDRIAYLGEHLFPPSDYMLEKYALRSRAWLPVLYLQRGVLGTWKRMHGL